MYSLGTLLGIYLFIDEASADLYLGARVVGSRCLNLGGLKECLQPLGADHGIDVHNKDHGHEE